MRRLGVLAVAFGVLALAASAPPASADKTSPRVRPATGGESISADTAATGVYTTLDGPTMKESAGGQIAAGAQALAPPAGFVFNAEPPGVRIKATANDNSQNTLRLSSTDACAGGGANDIMVMPEPGAIRFFVCTSSAGKGIPNTVRFSSVGVRPSAGTPLASGDICLDSASAGIEGVTPCGGSPTSFGFLKEVAGAPVKLVLSPATATVPSGTPQSYQSSTADQFGNALLNVTSSTTFSIAPSGSCASAACTPVLPVTHTVTGISGAYTGTATLNVGNAPPPSGGASFTVTSTNASTMTDASGARIFAIPRNDKSDVTITGTPTCETGSPFSVNVIFNGAVYPMTESPAGSGNYTATIPAAQVTDGDVSAFWTCPNGSFEENLGRIVLYDPSGLVSELLEEAAGGASAPSSEGFSRAATTSTVVPVEGASVTLYSVPSQTPEVVPDSDPNTCPTQATRGSRDYPPAPSDPSASVRVDPGGGTIAPTVNPFITNVQGLYGWLAATGCYYVVVTKDGFRSGSSGVAGVPPAVTDLDVQIQADVAPETTITLGPPPVTSSTNADFTFTSNDPDATFECSLDAAAFAACASPVALTGLATGSHTFAVRAISPTGKVDATPATLTWVVDLSPPVVEILRPRSGEVYVDDAAFPAGVGTQPVVVGAITVVARATAGPSGIASFQFTVDGAAVDPAQVSFDPATSQYSFHYQPASLGDHTIVATATNGVGLSASATVVMTSAVST